MNDNHIKVCGNCMKRIQGNVCDLCGYDNDDMSHHYQDALPRFTYLANGQYLVGNVMYSNSEGLTYIGLDLQQEKKVWIKEFMPEGMANRKSDSKLETEAEYLTQFKTLKIEFLDLNMSLKSLKNTASMIPILDCFEQNNTVYSILEYVECISLDEFLRQIGGKLQDQQAEAIFVPLFEFVSELHKNNIVHRGISPYTVFIDTDGNLRLNDFSISSARTDKSELVAELFPGYAAPEQYNVTSWQGTWTDVYAAAALLYRTITGIDPPDAQQRKLNDSISSIIKLEPSASKNISYAVSKALILVPENRLATMDIFVELIQNGPDELNSGNTTRQVDISKGPIVPQKRARKSTSSFVYTIFAMLGTTTLLLILMYFGLKKVDVEDVIQGESGSSSQQVSEVSQDNNSNDKDEYIVPDFKNTYMDNAYNDKGYGIYFTLKIDKKNDETVPADKVIEQSVEPGTVLTKDDIKLIVLTVSKGPVELMDMRSWSKDTAISYLTEKSLTYDIKEEYSNTVPEGKVIQYYKVSGKVTLVISKGKEVISQEPESSQNNQNQNNENQESSQNYWHNWNKDD